MNLILILAIVGAAVYLIKSRQNGSTNQREQLQLEDAIADARRWTERLGSQVLTISGTDAASTQAMADASERYNAASGALGQATTPKQAMLARESALEGLHYVNACLLYTSPSPRDS